FSYSQNYHMVKKQTESLPVHNFRAAFMEAFEKYPVIVMEGQTGSGKTTQIPQWVVEEGIKGVACTQPRRVAASSVSRRVAEEMDVQLGTAVGYSVRFDLCATPDTSLVYMTDGMLLRECVTDPLLKKYKCIILDEVHERTLATDILLGCLQNIIKKRMKDGFRVIVMSATLNVEKYQRFFSNFGAPLISVPGRMYKVEVVHEKKACPDYVKESVKKAMRIHMYEEPGDILIFLTGQREIENCCSDIARAAHEEDPEEEKGPLIVVPLYGSLPPADQQRAFMRAHELARGRKNAHLARKIVISTNIAETSLTIDGVVYVIDSGFQKMSVYRHEEHSSSLSVHPISKAAAKQRMGRAGRTRAGKCYRLYTEAAMEEEMMDFSPPELQRSDIASVVLQLYALGITNPLTFAFLDPPHPDLLELALMRLMSLGGTELTGSENPEDAIMLTPLGKRMASLPLSPEYARAVLLSDKYRCTASVLSVVSLLSVPRLFLTPQRKQDFEKAENAKTEFTHDSGDHGTFLNVFNAFTETRKLLGDDECRFWCGERYLSYRSLIEAGRVRDQLSDICARQGIIDQDLLKKDEDVVPLMLQAMCNGLFDNIAVKHDSQAGIGGWVTTRGCDVRLHPSTVLPRGNTPPGTFVLYDNYMVSSSSNSERPERVDYIITASELNPTKLLESTPPTTLVVEEMEMSNPFRHELAAVYRMSKKTGVIRAPLCSHEEAANGDAVVENKRRAEQRERARVQAKIQDIAREKEEMIQREKQIAEHMARMAEWEKMKEAGGGKVDAATFMAMRQKNRPPPPAHAPGTVPLPEEPQPPMNMQHPGMMSMPMMPVAPDMQAQYQQFRQHGVMMAPAMPQIPMPQFNPQMGVGMNPKQMQYNMMLQQQQAQQAQMMQAQQQMYQQPGMQGQYPQGQPMQGQPMQGQGQAYPQPPQQETPATEVASDVKPFLRAPPSLRPPPTLRAPPPPAPKRVPDAQPADDNDDMWAQGAPASTGPVAPPRAQAPQSGVVEGQAQPYTQAQPMGQYQQPQMGQMGQMGQPPMGQMGQQGMYQQRQPMPQMGQMGYPQQMQQQYPPQPYQGSHVSSGRNIMQ
ncbi:hypothetical protein KIPB_008203, partial [Kipferlia bialata]